MGGGEIYPNCNGCSVDFPRQICLSFLVFLALHVAIFRNVFGISPSKSAISGVSRVYPCSGCCLISAMYQVGMASRVQEASPWGATSDGLRTVFLHVARISALNLWLKSLRGQNIDLVVKTLSIPTFTSLLTITLKFLTLRIVN